MTYEQLSNLAIDIKNKYQTLNAKKGQAAWGGQEFMAGFVGDIGELSEIIMAKHGLRDLENVDEKLAHELSDCLWSVLILASVYNIDLESEFVKTMDQLSARIDKQLSPAA